MIPATAMLISSFLLVLILFILTMVLSVKAPNKRSTSSKRVKDDIRKIKEQVSHGY